MTQALPQIRVQQSRPLRLPHYDATNVQAPVIKRENLDKINMIEKELRIIVLSTISLILCDKWNETYRMVVNHAKNKDGYTSLRDYSGNKNAVNICKTMHARIGKFYDELYALQEEINFRSKSKVEDPLEYWATQTDTACKLFDSVIRKCLAAVYAQFRKSVRAEDPVMFSNVVKLVYMSGMFTNLLDSFIGNMTPQEVKPFKRLCPAPLAFELSKQLLMRNEDGKILAFAYYGEMDEVRDILRTKKFYLGHKTEEFAILYPVSIFHSEDIVRRGWEIERYLYDFSTISKIRESVGLEKIDYRKIFKMDRDVPCCETYPQYKIGIMMNRHEYKAVLDLLDDFESEIPLYRGKKTEPVIGFFKNPKAGIKGEPAVLFKGIWNSCGEASRETGERFITIAAVKKANDKKDSYENGNWNIEHGAVWISFKVFRLLIERLVEKEYESLRLTNK